MNEAELEWSELLEEYDARTNIAFPTLEEKLLIDDTLKKFLRFAERNQLYDERVECICPMFETEIQWNESLILYYCAIEGNTETRIEHLDSEILKQWLRLQYIASCYPALTPFIPYQFWSES